eukprot:3902048-Pyramimonas_sp.AAC.1
MNAFKEKGLFDKPAEDEELDEEGDAIMKELDITHDAQLEYAAACGFANVGSQSAIGKRYALFRRGCQREQDEYEQLAASEKKKRVVDWAKGKYSEYQDAWGRE